MLGPGWIAIEVESSSTHLKNASLLYICRTHGCKFCLLSELRDLGSRRLDGSCKRRGARCAYINSFLVTWFHHLSQPEEGGGGSSCQLLWSLGRIAACLEIHAKIRSQTYRQQLVKCAVGPLSGRDSGMRDFALSVLSPGDIATASGWAH